MDAGLTGVGQIALTVRDLDAAVAFYRDVLGLRYQFTAGHMAFFDCGPVRLMLAFTSDEARANSIVYFRAPDVVATAQALEERGANLMSPPHLVAKQPDHELWMAFVRDPEGNVLGLMTERR